MWLYRRYDLSGPRRSRPRRGHAGLNRSAPWRCRLKWKTRPRGAAASSLPRGLMAPGLLGAVATVFAHVVAHHVHGEPGPLGHQHAAKHAKLMLLRLVEAVVQGLGGVGDLLDVRCALRQTVRHRFKIIYGRHLFALRPRL